MPDSSSDLSGKEHAIIEIDRFISGEGGEILQEEPETRWWFNVPHLRSLAIKVVFIALCSSNTGYLTSCMANISGLSQFLDVAESPLTSRLSAITSGVAFGTIASVFFATYLGDYYGRKKVIAAGQVITIIGTLVQGGAVNYGSFLASRVIVGLGLGLYAVNAPVLISEVAYPSHRTASVFLYGTAYHFGALFPTWIEFGTRFIHGSASWRIPTYLQIVFPLVQLLLLTKVPESPRYLVSNGNVQSARMNLLESHNSRKSAEEELQIIVSTLEEEGVKSSYTKFAMGKYLKRFYLVVFISILPQLFTNGITSALMFKFMTTMTLPDVTSQLAINGVLYIVNFVVVAIIGVIAAFVKRRIIFMVSLVAMLFCYLIWLIFAVRTELGGYTNKWTAAGTFAFILIYSVANFIGMSGMPYVYVMDVVPYKFRTKGSALMQLIMALVVVYNNFVHPIALSTIKWKYYMVFVPIYTVFIPIFYFTVPEISAHFLEEVAQVFESTSDAPETIVEKTSIHHVERV